MIINGKEIGVGHTASEQREVTLDAIRQYAEISGDFNPVHLDEEYAAQSFFGGRIAHGLFCLGMISKIVGTEMPGIGSIFLNERIDYKNPAYLGDTITTEIKVLEIKEEKKILNLGINCTNQNGQVILCGTTLVKMV